MLVVRPSQGEVVEIVVEGVEPCLRAVRYCVEPCLCGWPAARNISEASKSLHSATMSQEQEKAGDLRELVLRAVVLTLC